MSFLLLLLACSPDPACPEGQVLQDGACVPYQAGDPVPCDDCWHPSPGTTWQIQYTGALDTGVEVQMFDLDLFDSPDRALSSLHDAGRAVICYFSAGSYEDWRDDAGDFPASALGDPLDGWEGEWWLDIRDPMVREIMEARLDAAVERGCDGVDPDNVNAYTNDSGFALTATDQLSYNRFLADAAHSRGLSVALKNDVEQIEELEPWFDFQVNEECASYDECGLLAPFTGAGKAAFHIEYVDDWEDAEARAAEVCGVGPNLDTLLKTWELGPEYLACGR
jgi:hypothetical protein